MERGKFTIESIYWKKREGGKAVFLVRDVEWLWSMTEVEVPEPDHICGPDCPCHKFEKKMGD